MRQAFVKIFQNVKTNFIFKIMEEINRSVTAIHETSLMLIGLTFKIEQSRQMSDDNIKMMDRLTNSLSKHSDKTLKEGSGIDKKLHDKQAASEAAKENLAKNKEKPIGSKTSFG